MSELILIEIIELPTGVKAYSIEGTPNMSAQSALDCLITSAEIVQQGRAIIAAQWPESMGQMSLETALKPTIVNLNDLQQ